MINSLYAGWMEYRNLCVSESELALQAGVLLLFDSNLHPVLHAGDCIVGVVLVGRQRCSGSRVPRCHNAVDNGHPNHRHQQFLTTSLLYQGKLQYQELLHVLPSQNPFWIPGSSRNVYSYAYWYAGLHIYAVWIELYIILVWLDDIWGWFEHILVRN